ncbi:N-acetyllactosaminide beta-1,3-N-acetylglucosaminyltransferase 2 isoform X1 [Carassius gibelio]|uniref:N-acetyllactosaminide beta-1,3-N-acetylglucosaminyltransferase 2 isoform X1 n=2 Tax=Carassius gibelio TaxID=101364 RepID=UPI0022799AAE|nr:N-acetyllactosaminide beta-1,3-N-acetylglucosaminyltransferase 2 isoform X1 [Carassius gibelio]
MDQAQLEAFLTEQTWKQGGSGVTLEQALLEGPGVPGGARARPRRTGGKGIFKMNGSWKTTKLLGLLMLANILIYVVVEVSRSYGQGRDMYRRGKLTPKKFWKTPEVSLAFWNRMQDRLDDIYYLPLANGSEPPPDFQGIPRWLNRTSPCQPDSRVTTEIEDFKSLPQRFQDFLLYMGCRSYPLITDAPNVCSEPPYLLLAVKSIAAHFDRRQAIRESWGRAGILDGRRIVTVFLLGSMAATDHFPNLSDMVKHESALYGDVLQWDYRDSFFNLTLKEVLFLEWFGTHCASAKYVFKGDDDVFVNTQHILAYLGNVSKTQDLFVGDVIANAGPHRTKHLKYYIPESVFRGIYPPYAGGGGYLYSGNLGLRLRTISRLVTLYPIDDVYTGMCLKRLGLVPEKHMGFKTFDIEEKHRENPCAYKSLILVHPRSPQDMIKIWSWINDPKAECYIAPTTKGAVRRNKIK